MSLIEAMARAMYGAFEAEGVLDKYGAFAGGFRFDGVVDAPALVRAALAEARKQGFVLVPREMTDAMWEAGDKARHEGPWEFIWDELLRASPAIEDAK